MVPQAYEDSDSPAWKILQSRLLEDTGPVAETGAETSDVPAEEPPHITSVIASPDRDRTLFATQSESHQGPGTIAGSLVLHAVAGAIIWFSLGYKPPYARVITEHYALRQIDMSELAEEAAHARIQYPAQQHAPVARPRSASSPPPPSHAIATLKPSAQTLIQPDLPKPVTLAQEIPVPRVILWSPSKAIVRKIVPPAPKKPAPDAIPVLDQPNQEIKLADVNIASNHLLSLKSHLLPSTTSPISGHQPSQTPQTLSSAAQMLATPSPAAILSLSDIKLQSGTVLLPPVTESPASGSKGGLAPGKGPNASAQAGNGNSTAKGQGVSGKEIGADALDQLTTTPIALSRDGHFAVVIVGNDLDQEYPEIDGVWGGRVAYTAYLHVGLSKSWLLQYSLPPNADAAPGGAAGHLDAPWPYNIVRPNLAPGAINADALMIHGFINTSGRFEKLNVVFPQPFPIAQFVLNAMQQWQFRPATQNGHPARVEVLLIVPETLE